MSFKPDNLLTPLETLPGRLLLGVSGGIDSISLFHALVATKREITVLHFNHNWRPESHADSRWVKELADRYECPFLGGRAPTAAPKTESNARQLRWKFFHRAASKAKCSELVLAQQADDQVETFLLQLLRGTGGGWHGMDSIRTHSTLHVHRPWLKIWRDQIQEYAGKNKLVWREDPSNFDQRHLRNCLRHEIIPLLEKASAPHLRQRLWQTAETLGLQTGWVESMIEPDRTQQKLEVTSLRQMHPGHQRALLFGWLKSAGIEDISHQDVVATQTLLTKLTPARINLSKGRHARRQKGWLFIE